MTISTWLSTTLRKCKLLIRCPVACIRRGWIRRWGTLTRGFCEFFLSLLYLYFVLVSLFGVWCFVSVAVSVSACGCSLHLLSGVCVSCLVSTCTICPSIALLSTVYYLPSILLNLCTLARPLFLFPFPLQSVSCLLPAHSLSTLIYFNFKV